MSTPAPTPAERTRLLVLVGNGLASAVAVAWLGYSPETLRRWRRADPTLTDDIVAAEGAFEQRLAADLAAHRKPLNPEEPNP